MFLYLESRETMMHVAGLLQFTPPRDAPPDHLRKLVDEIRTLTPAQIQRPWNLKLRTPDLLVNPLQAWVEDKEFDLDYHVRRSALPSPGDERELGIIVSRLHGHQVDFHRPPWELHVIEGLEGGRFALYAKVHHSLVDGYSAMRILSSSLSRSSERDSAAALLRRAAAGQAAARAMTAAPASSTSWRRCARSSALRAASPARS